MISEKKYLMERFNELREYNRHRAKSCIFLCHKTVLDRCLTFLSGMTSNILLFDQVYSDFSDKVGIPEFVLHENDATVNFEKYIKDQSVKLYFPPFDPSCKYNKYYGVLFDQLNKPGHMILVFFR